MLRNFLGFIICFVLTVAVFPLGIKLISKLKAKQEILHYVKSHAGKAGTPTMGGIIFTITIAGTTLCMLRGEITLALISTLIMVGYAIVGFLDDFIKVHFKRNLGLRAYQKIIFQVAISLIVGFLTYFTVSSSVLLPFTTAEIELGYGIIPFVVLVFLSCTNCVNLTDGLDGLAGSVTFIYLTGFLGVGFILFPALGLDAARTSEIDNILILASTACGGILGFLCFNSHPAKVFMGDTGSLALGGLLAVISVFTRTELLIPILGIMFVLSGISVIIQVLHFKRTRTRIFLMAPLHHHFEKKGMHEAKIVSIYSTVTTLVAVTTVAVYYLLITAVG